MNITPRSFLSNQIGQQLTIFDPSSGASYETTTMMRLASWGHLYSLDIDNEEALYCSTTNDLQAWVTAVEAECMWTQHISEQGLMSLEARQVILVDEDRGNMPAYISLTPTALVERGIRVIDTTNPDASTQFGCISDEIDVAIWMNALRYLSDDCVRLTLANIILPEATHICVMYDDLFHVEAVRHFFFNIFDLGQEMPLPPIVERSFDEVVTIASSLADDFIGHVLEFEASQQISQIEEVLGDADEHEARINALIMNLEQELTARVKQQIQAVIILKDTDIEEAADPEAGPADPTVVELGNQLYALDMEEDESDPSR